MSYYGRRRLRGGARENNSFWLSFSDLMSALLLVFVLIMFYSVYQYFDMLEVKTAELVRQSGLLDEKEAELNEKDAALAESEEKLNESEQELLSQQAKLLLNEKELETSQQLLAQQQEELDAARAQLAQQQEQMTQQQTLLTNQQAQMAEQQEKLDAMVGVRARIIASLGAALNQADIKATVDAQSGAITLDASVLFDLGKSELKESGKAVLDQFLPVYLSVLLSDENRQNISEIIIEGHTDSMGTYMSNLELSQQRALAVMQYILDDSYPYISTEMKSYLRQIATANGRSFSNPVLDEYGNEDAEASRRVEFKFRMQDEQMIESMRQLLEDMG